MRDRIIKFGLPLFFFLLPWHTGWIFAQAEIVGQPFSMGSMTLYLTEVLLFIIALAFFFKKESWKGKGHCKLLLAFFLFATISILFAVNVDLAWTQLMHLGFAGVLFFILSDKEIDLRTNTKAFLVGLLIPVFLGLWQVFSGGSIASSWFGIAVRDAVTLGDAVIEVGGERVLRAYGSFSHPNIFGGYLAIAMLGIVYLWQEIEGRKEKILIYFSAFVVAIGLAATFSRSAWLGLTIAIFAASGVLFVYGKPVAKYGKFLAGFMAFIIVFSTLGLVSGRLDPSSRIESTSLTERIEQYQDFPMVMTDNSWILGNGLANYSLTLAEIDPSQEWWQYQPVHNVPLLIIGEAGFVAFFLLVLFAARIDIINFRRFPNSEAVIAFAMGNVLLTILFFDHYLWSTWSGLALAAYVLALTFRLGESYDRK